MDISTALLAVRLGKDFTLSLSVSTECVVGADNIFYEDGALNLIAFNTVQLPQGKNPILLSFSAMAQSGSGLVSNDIEFSVPHSSHMMSCLVTNNSE